MSEASGDVERHFLELENQLKEDGFEADSVVMKTTNRLRRSLHSDGFAFASVPEDVTEDDSTEDDSTEETVTVIEKPKARAFQAKNSYDTEVITQMFAEVGGWTTRIIHRGKSYYVVAKNDDVLSDAQVKEALQAYRTETLG